MKGKILIVDDNAGVLDSLDLFLKNKFDKITTLRNPNHILSQLGQDEYDIVLLDMNFTAGVNTGNEGLFWLRKILKTEPTPIIILITAYGDIELAVTAMKDGATDFIVKPWDNKKLLATIQAAMKLRESQIEVSKLKSKQKLIAHDINKHFKMFTGNSETMRHIYSTIAKVAKTDASVLITGENGTGKEVVAREIHAASKRHNEVFVSVDLGSLTETLFESEMFGHVKGAFTDAKENRTGRFENASGGTLFLDEIGNLSLSLQAKLLTVLESRMVTPVGSNKAIPFNIRLISATNKNILKMSETGTFRQDLFYRINTVTIELPPLRERGNDILILAEHFLKEFSEKYEKQKLRYSTAANETLLYYKWPGNIRELKHTIEKAVILSDSEIIHPENFGLDNNYGHSLEQLSAISIGEAEKKIIKVSLDRHKWNISEAARELNIGRQTLYRKIRNYGLQ
jgi:DNA-binding NtrC family response regulator